MAKNQRDFFKKKNEWSEIKDTLLRCYLPQYFQKLLVSGKPIFYIDCFAGKGKFDDGNDGSPLIAMQIINERLGMSRISRKNNAIVPCFIELNHAADLEQNLMLHPYQYGTPQVVDGKFEDNIRGLLKDKRGYNVFLYIDPYGIQALDSQLFDEIGTYGFRSFEMLINFNSFGFFRDACRVMKVDISQDDALMGLDDLVEYEPTTVTASPQSENLFFVMMGEAGPALTDDNMLDSEGNSTPSGTTWLPMRRAGTNSLRKDRPRLCYPIYADVKTERIVKVGEFLPPEEKIENNYRITDGLVEIWPVKTNGDEGRWQLQGDTVMSRVSMGTVKAVPKSNGTWTIQYLNEGALKEIDEGTLVVTGRDANGVLIVERSSAKSVAAKSIWNKVTHDATANGTNLIAKIIGNSRFSFPKSLYAEHDAIRFFVASNPDALIIDFFAGSGTTLHAVNLLNAEDGGHRRCILVTNNEVSADEAKALTERGFQPGDEEWNKLGIARYVTWPRTVCSIEGHDVNGKPLKGDYITSGEEPMHMADGFKANAAFFKLGFLDKNAVALGRQFKELLPVLWLKAGAHGPCPALEETAEAPDMLVLPVNRFAVLTDESQYEEFAARVNGEDSITTVYIVTDSEPGYREMVSGLHAEDTYQLYRDYLDNFRINHGGR